MMTGAAPHHEVVSSLSEEIRQTLAWLAEQDEPPSALDLRARVRTLREAAGVAGMHAVSRALDELDTELDDSDRAVVELEARMELVLGRLSALLASMAASVEKHELEWIELLGRLERNLEGIAAEIQETLQRLSERTGLLDACMTASSGALRLELLERLRRQLAEESRRQRGFQRQVKRAGSDLHVASHALVRNLGRLRCIPLTSLALRLRDEARELGLGTNRPLSLHPRCNTVDIGVRQAEPLHRVMAWLIRQIINEGLEEPAGRRAAGKPTVASIRLLGHQTAGLITLVLEDDGVIERALPVVPSAIGKDLGLLRARLLREDPGDAPPRLLLQLPAWHPSLEFLPVRTRTGVCAVPLQVVAEVFRAGRQPENLPVIELDRRDKASAMDPAGSGVVLQLEDWRGVLYAEIQGPRQRAVPTSPEPADPPWVIGRVQDDTGSRALIHPLPFMEHGEGRICVFPAS